MPPCEQFFVLLTLLLFSCHKSLAIDCYQCSGTNNTNQFQCNEWLSSVAVPTTRTNFNVTRRFEGIHPKWVPLPCDRVYGAKYCIKHTGRFEGGIGTKRFCSSLDLGNYCNYVRQPGDKLTYRTFRSNRDTSLDVSECDLVIDDEDDTCLVGIKKKSKGVRLTEEPLRLVCDWNDCKAFYHDYREFIDHISNHILDIKKKEQTNCKWSDCNYTASSLLVLAKHNA
ncbi:hypothetical protein QE152_g27558 [Popillia japonica]|uniref:C2H2-type domain-containing protein n=1 Tax=Popillia japonica TaxID=7064 RepID=A0AAW1JV29_POPJA